MFKSVRSMMKELDKIPGCTLRYTRNNEIPPRFNFWRPKHEAEGYNIFESTGERVLSPGEERVLSPGEIVELKWLFSKLDKAFEKDGIEALAWYSPYHYYYESDWGIFIPELSLHYAADRWFNKRISYAKRLDMAYEAFMGHELVHFASEYMVSQHEIYLNSAGYVPSREKLKSYVTKEEALANANKLLHLRGLYPRYSFSKLERAMRKSPPGYRDYAAALGAKGHEVHIVAVLKAKIGDAAIDSGLFSEAVNQTAFWPKINQIRGFCPVSILETDTHGVRLPPYTVGYIQNIPTIRETNKFKKQLAKIRDQRIISDWNKKKASLAERIPRFPEFEKFPQRDCFSLRLVQGYRAHLSKVGTDSSEWVALEVGSHKAMGHG